VHITFKLSMKYSTITISSELVLSKISDYTIFKYYLGRDFKLGIVIKSPLRNDKNPSFGVYKSKTGTLLFNDFATGDKGDCFKLVSLLYNVPYNDAIKLVYDNMLQGTIKQEVIPQHIIDNIKPTVKNITIQRRYFVECDEKYWSMFNIKRSTVKKFNVMPIHSFNVDDLQSRIIHSEASPMYAYLVNTKIKIYKPLGSRYEKWRGNLSLFDLFGYEQLPDFGELLIITKSLKDVMCLYELGYTAIAPASETSTIPEKTMTELKLRFNKIIVLYDNDNPGISAALKVTKKHSLKSIVMPFFDDIVTKDISDYIKLKSFADASKTLNRLINES
jgi:hypothetical protein